MLFYVKLMQESIKEAHTIPPDLTDPTSRQPAARGRYYPRRTSMDARAKAKGESQSKPRYAKRDVPRRTPLSVSTVGMDGGELHTVSVTTHPP